MDELQALDQLAKTLAINHTHNSEFSIEKAKVSSLAAKGYSRCIFIIGAGASCAVEKELFPLGDDAANKIERFFKESLWTDGTFAMNEQLLRQQQLLRNAKKDSFEERLSRLSHFVSESKVQDALKELFGAKPYPNLSYELIAHLFKNRFIDVIIDFNFDETLYSVLKEEMQSAQWVKILTDGDVKDYSEILVANKLNSPVYIKSHGTISHKSSMRFTKDQYLTIPDDIRKIMYSLFTDQFDPEEKLFLIKKQQEQEAKKKRLKPDQHEDIKFIDSTISKIKKSKSAVIERHKERDLFRIPSFRDLHFISLGFEMESVELNRLIKDTSDIFNQIKDPDGDKLGINLYSFEFEETRKKFDKNVITKKKTIERVYWTQKHPIRKTPRYTI